jgi:hypothetical protein
MSKSKQQEWDDRIRAHVEKVVADAPPLTDEQRARIASLLRPRPAAPPLAATAEAAAGDELLRSLR